MLQELRALRCLSLQPGGEEEGDRRAQRIGRSAAGQDAAAGSCRGRMQGASGAAAARILKPFAATEQTTRGLHHALQVFSSWHQGEGGAGRRPTSPLRCLPPPRPMNPEPRFRPSDVRALECRTEAAADGLAGDNLQGQSDECGNQAASKGWRSRVGRKEDGKAIDRGEGSTGRGRLNAGGDEN